MRLLILMLGVLAVASASASFLLWQVEPTSLEDGGNTADDYSYTDARIGYYETSAANSGQTLAGLDAAGIVRYGDVYQVDGGAMVAPANFDMSNLGADYTYFIELVNYDAANVGHVAYGEALTYAELASRGYVSPSFSVDSIAVPKVWHGGAFNAVPEPTGTVLLVFGMSFLALRRRVS